MVAYSLFGFRSTKPSCNNATFAILPILLAVGYILFKTLFYPDVCQPPRPAVSTGSAWTPQQEQALGLQAYKQVLQKEGGNVVSERRGRGNGQDAWPGGWQRRHG